MKSHDDSHRDKRKSSSKKSFWVSPDISSGIEKLFALMGLDYKSNSLLISMNLCRISVTGFITYLLGVPICWRSNGQKGVTLSSSKAEYVAIS
jgi:hypothetical protein